MKFEDCKTEGEKNAFMAGKMAGKMAEKGAEFNAVISFAQTALKIPILINGGAAIAILALMGNTWNEKNSLAADLAFSLLFFSIGVFVVAIGTGLSYLAQYRFQYVGEGDTTAHVFRWAAIVFIIISYILFMFGAWWAFDTFST